ncbi:carboxypeptidase regulatory-like domain-containing protein [Nocardioides hankookensis]|uniref:alpha-amylase n=1 Tax=Nocardioides hankookensis TaxID=443157 RepID=A0ABW1LDQ4_9ACTN
MVALLGALLLVPLAVVLGSAPAQAAPATLIGTVVDGLGAQLVGVTVQAVDSATLTDVPGAGASDVTDGTGSYSLELSAGTYKIRFSKTGYTSDWYGGEDAFVITVDGDGVASVDDEPIEDGDLGPIVINSVTTHTISGTATKAGGDPLAGILVEVYANDDHDDVVQTLTTSSDGAFSFTLPEGVYHVALSDPAHMYLPRWYGMGSTPDDITLSSNRALGAIVLSPVPAGSEFPIAGRVLDANGDTVTGVTVAVGVSEGTGDSGSDTTGATGDYSVTVLPGTYRVTFSGTGFQTRQYGVDGGTSTITVAADGQLSTAPTESLVDNKLGDFTLPSTPYAKTGTVHAASGGAAVPNVTVRAFPADSDLLADVVDTTTTDAGGTYSLDLPIGTYHVQVVDLDGVAPDYQPTWIGGATPVVVKVAQGGTLTVNGGSSVTTLGDVLLSVASVTTTYDVSGDVVDANGDPIPSATVTAVPQSGTPAENQATATTNGTGHYVLSVKAGTYRISYAATDFNSSAYTGSGSVPVDVVVSGTGTVTAGTTEAPGGALEDVELTGTATYQVTGTVEDATNDASIVGIHVTVHPTSDPSATAGTGTTNASGVYTVPGLTVGTYTIDFTDTDGSGFQYVGASYGGSPATEVKIARGGAAIVANATRPGNDLGVTKLARSTADTTYAVSGDLTDANGDAIVGASVTAVPQGATPGANQVAKTTDSDGHYVLDLKVGTYRIKYDAAAFTTSYYSNDNDPPVVVDVVVASGGTVTAGGVAVPNRELEDTALVGTNTHTITGSVKSGGAAVSGLTVKLYSTADSSTAIDTATTNGSGVYTFGGLKIGTYLVQVESTSSYVGAWYVDSQTSAGATEVKIGQSLLIYSGGSPTAPNGTLLAMNLAPVTAETTYVVSGEVVDANSDGIVGRPVTATAISTGVTASTFSGDDGQFVLNLKPGTYHVTVAGNADFGSGFLTSDDETPSALVVASTSPNVTVDGEPATDGDVGSITLAGLKTYSVTGTATNGSTGLPGITVEALPSGSTPGATTTTGSGGAFGFSLKIGSYRLRFTDNTSNATRYQQTYFGGEPPKEVQVGQSGVVTVDGTPSSLTTVLTAVTADTAYDLKGTVYEPVNFDPLDGVVVTAIPVAGTATANQREGTTGPDASLGDGGVYRIPVKPGKYQLRFEKPGYQTAYLTNYDDTTAPVTVTVGPTGAISAPGLDLVDGVLDDVQMLFPPAAFKVQPKLSGKVAVGQVVSTTFGTLQGASIDKDYVIVEWFIDGKPADDYSTGNYFEKFKIPAVAATKKLSYRITIDDPDGVRASTVFTSKAIAVPKAPATVKGVFKKGKLTVTLTVPTLPKPTGVIVVKDGKKKVATIKLTAKSKGKAVLPLSKLKLKPGKHTLTLAYAGSKTINKAAGKVKLTVKK